MNLLYRFLIFIFLVNACILTAGDKILQDGETVRIKYQFKSQNAKAWTNSSATLKNVPTENIILNQLQSRHRNALVRILSADNGKSYQMAVKYQYRAAGQPAWTSSSVILESAGSETMAVNQLLSKHQDSEVRIVSMVRR